MSNLIWRIRESTDTPSELVEIPEWDGVTILIRGLTVKGRMQWEKHIIGPNGQPKVGADAFGDMIIPLLSLCMCDPVSKQPIFETLEECKQVLLEKNAAVISRIADVARKLSGIGTSQEQEKN